MLFRRLVVGVMVLTPAIAVAQESPPRSRPAAPEMGPGPAARERFGLGPRRVTSEREQEDAGKFMAENSPNRWKAIESLPGHGPMHRVLMNVVVARWRSLESARTADPKLYDIKLSELKVEDEVYGLLAGTQSAADREPLRQKLTEASKQLIDLNMEERQHRIDRLRQLLKGEEERLQADRGHADLLVERKVTSLINEGVSLRPDLLHRPVSRDERRGGRQTPAPTTAPSVE